MGNFVSAKRVAQQQQQQQQQQPQSVRGGQVKEVDRPITHITDKGWINDPNGPIKVDGTYHLFYQHVPNKCEWSFGIVWGHASSTDLVHWKDHPYAIEPTPGSLDADGCFSGCCVVGEDGSVTMIYTGVRLRSKLAPHELPPEGHDLHLEFIESQLVASVVAGDKELNKWEKKSVAAIPIPPRGLALTGWRDPFVLPRSSSDESWTMILGSGIKGQGGAVMIYKSTNLASGWYFDGFLASGDGETGAMWECPLLARLPFKAVNLQTKTILPKSTSVGGCLFQLPEDGFSAYEMRKSGSSRSQSVDMTAMMAKDNKSFQIPTALEHVEEAGSQHFFCISPDSPENPVLYWLGDYRDGKFIIKEAKGPFLLDLGDTTYAPNMLQDEKGNQILWIWIRDHEKEKVPFMDNQGYAGCLSTPRKLCIHNGKLFQEPTEEIDGMRSTKQWQAQDLVISPSAPLSVTGVGGQALDMKLTFNRESSSAVGLQLHALKIGYENAAIIFDWETSTLRVIVNPEGSYPFVEGSRTIGGVIDLVEEEHVTLRVLIDYSSIEIFTHTGQVLTTRVYRGQSTPNCNPGIDLVTYGGVSKIPSACVYQLNSIWDEAENETRVADSPVSQASITQASTVSSNFSVDRFWCARWSGTAPEIVTF